MENRLKKLNSELIQKIGEEYFIPDEDPDSIFIDQFYFPVYIAKVSTANIRHDDPVIGAYSLDPWKDNLFGPYKYKEEAEKKLEDFCSNINSIRTEVRKETMVYPYKVSPNTDFDTFNPVFQEYFFRESTIRSYNYEDYYLNCKYDIVEPDPDFKELPVEKLKSLKDRIFSRAINRSKNMFLSEDLKDLLSVIKCDYDSIYLLSYQEDESQAKIEISSLSAESHDDTFRDDFKALNILDCHPYCFSRKPEKKYLSYTNTLNIPQDLKFITIKDIIDNNEFIG